MKIRRVIIDGFGKLQNQQVRFAPNRVNLLVEENEFGKSTIAEAICAALYGFPRERETQKELTRIDAMRPLSGGRYKVALELSVAGRHFKVTRDFEDGSVEIIDLETRDDVKGEFFPKKGQPQIGEKLTGLSRAQFQETSFIGHHSLVHHAADADSKRSFEEIASSSRDSKTAAQAIEALSTGLNRLRGAKTGAHGAPIKVDTEIVRIQGEATGIEARLRELEDNKRRNDGDIGKWTVLKQEIDAKQQEKVELERLRLAANVRELKARVSEQERYRQDLERLRQEREELVGFETFPAAINENLVRWLGQLNTKTVELRRLETEITHTKEELSKLTLQLTPRFSNLTTFGSVDRDKLVAAREQLRSIDTNFAASEEARQLELDALRNGGILPARFDELENKLSGLDRPTREAVIGYPKQREQLVAELERNERSVKEQQRTIESVDAERGRSKRSAMLLAGASGTLTVIFGVLFFASTELRPLWVILSAVSLLSSLLLLLLAQRAAVSRADERSKAVLDSEQATGAVEAARASLQQLGIRFNSFAKSSGIETANELAAMCLEHLRLAEALREFRRLTDELNLLEQQRGNVHAEVLPGLQRGGLTLRAGSQVTQQVLTEICSELEAYFGLLEQIETVKDRLGRQELEQQRAKEDVDPLVERLKSGFREADIRVEDATFEEAYNLFKDKLRNHQKLKRVDEGIERLDKIKIQEAALLTLKDEQESAQARLLDIGATELVPQKTQGQYSDELVRINSELEHLAEEITQIRLAISKALGDYERESEELLERKDELETYVDQVISYRDAVTLALDKLQSIASDVHREWSVSLNAICEDMLSTINSNYRSIRFADDLSFSVETARSGMPLTMRDVRSRLSLGAQEQLFLLQRLAVSRFLSDDVRLPLILDDPLVTSDDDRFLELMRFVIEALPEDHQVLLFSCHKRRHEWLHEQLGDLFAERVHMVQLEPI